MAVRFDASADNLRRTTGTICTGPALSWCGWYKRKVDTGAFATGLYLHNTGGTATEIWCPETEGGGDVAHGYFIDGGAEIDLTGPTLTIDTWFFVAGYRDNSGRALYYGTEAGGTLTKVSDATARSMSNNTFEEIYIGNDIYTEPFNGEIAFVRLWEVKLTDAEFDAEWRSTTPVKAGVRGDWRLATAASATTDSSGNSLTLTVGGTLADATDPTPPAAAAGKGILLYKNPMSHMLVRRQKEFVDGYKLRNGIHVPRLSGLD